MVQSNDYGAILSLHGVIAVHLLLCVCVCGHLILCTSVQWTCNILLLGSSAYAANCVLFKIHKTKFTVCVL